jgi:hypothetical protein
MKKRMFTNDDDFQAVVDVANYSAKGLSNVDVVWRITKEDGSLIKSGKLNVNSIPTEGLTRAGSIEHTLSSIREATRLNLEVELVDLPYANDWDFWVFPATLPSIDTSDIHVAIGLDEQVEAKLNSGAKVLLLFPPSSVRGNTLGTFQPIFWNRITFPRQKVHMMGILCDSKHPAMAEFPTAFHASWQWQDLLDNCQPVIMDELPQEVKPIVRPIDDWNDCRKLGLIFEASVERGKVLVCSVDINTDLENRITARQLRHSLLSYMLSDNFNPQAKLTFAQVKGLFK